MAKPIIVLGLVSDWENHCMKNFALDIPPTGPWNGYKYYMKCIGNADQRQDFQDWAEANIPVEHRTNEAATRRSPRANWYFNSDDFAMLVKLTWETE